MHGRVLFEKVPPNVGNRCGFLKQHVPDSAAKANVSRTCGAASLAGSRGIFKKDASREDGSASGSRMAKVLIDSNALLAAANLLRSMGATEVFVFGSATKDGLQPNSDIDMAVSGLPSKIYFSAISRVSDLLGRPVDLVDLDDATPLVRHLLDSGELVRVA